MADCCYSGALVTAATSLEARGHPALALTSASQANISTGSWSFTQSLLDGLDGRALQDGNQDGQITLSELAAEVQEVMKYREGQMCGYYATSRQAELHISRTRKPESDLSPPGANFPLGDWALAGEGAQTQPARVLGLRGQKVVVELYHYNHYKSESNLQVARSF